MLPDRGRTGEMSRIYIGRLSYNAREKDVDRFFRGFGRIKDINLKNGFGFVVSERVALSFLTFLNQFTRHVFRSLMTQGMPMMQCMN